MRSPTDSALACLNKAWKAHEVELRRFLLHHTGHSDDADDQLQESFLRALLQDKSFCRIEKPVVSTGD